MSREPSPRRALGTAAVVLGGLLGVVALAWSSVALAPPSAPSSSWWPASGVGIAVVVLSGRRVAIGFAVACLPLVTLAIWTGGRPGDLAVAFGVAVVAEIVVGGFLLRALLDVRSVAQSGERASLSRLDSFWRVCAAALAGALACSVIAATAVWLQGQPVLEFVRNVIASHWAGTLLVVPAALLLRRPGPHPPRLETTFQALTLVGALGLSLGLSTGGGLLALAPLPLLVWAALRLGTRVVVAELLVVAIAITLAARVGSGPFLSSAGGSGTAEDTVYLFAALTQSYIICAILTAVPLAVTMEQRRELLHRVLASERVLRRSFTDSVVGMLELRDDGDDLRVVDLNDTARGMFGDGDPALGRRVGDLFDLDGSVLRATVMNGAPWRAEVGLRGNCVGRFGLAVSPNVGAGSLDTRAAQLVDLTPMQEAHERAERERELSRAVAETAACLILLVDVDGVLVAANPAATAMLGWEEEELVGRFVWELLPADRQGELRRAIADLPENPLPQSSEADLLCRDGGRRRLLWSSDFARDPDGVPTLLVMTGIDVTAERRQQLLVSQLLSAAMTTAIVGADADGRIAFFNTGAERLLGTTADRVVGTPFVEIFDPAAAAERFGTGLAGETPEEAFFRLTRDVDPYRAPIAEDLIWLTRDGARRTVSTTLSSIADPDLGIGFLCIGRDVTEQRQSQEMVMAALEKERTAVERLQALDHAKNDFVSTVSHELRTPVTSIVGYTEMLRDGTLEEPTAEQAPFLAAIARNADRLISLADDLLTLSGLESGAAELGRERIDLVDLVEQGKETLTPLLRGRDLAMTYRLPDAGVVVHGAVEHLDRVLVNLVSNAVKFTDDGGRIDVDVDAVDGEAVLTVSDTGIGIPAEEQARLFTKFFRSSTAQERAIQGTGLGLSIVHSIVAAHGGRILVRSAHLAGTTFSVRLPLRDPGRAAPGEGGTAATGRAEPSRAPADPPRVTPG